MSRTILKLLVAIIAALPTAAQSQEARAYAIMDSASGYMLDAGNADEKLQVGSVTKIATGLVVLDWALATSADFSQLATVSPQAAATGGVNAVGFQPGDAISLRDLLYAALMQSDNIAAQTLAEHVGARLPQEDGGRIGPADRFVVQMNALARKLGMSRTVFLNPHGLDHLERKPPHSTANDMARLTREAMSRGSFRFYVAQEERPITIVKATGQQSRYLLKNTNELLGIDAIDGVKTGMTRRAGPCVIISAARPPESRREGETFHVTPQRLIVVVLDAPNRFATAHELLKRGWRQYEQWVAAGRPRSEGAL